METLPGIGIDEYKSIEGQEVFEWNELYRSAEVGFDEQSMIEHFVRTFNVSENNVKLLGNFSNQINERLLNPNLWSDETNYLLKNMPVISENGK